LVCRSDTRTCEVKDRSRSILSSSFILYLKGRAGDRDINDTTPRVSGCNPSTYEIHGAKGTFGRTFVFYVDGSRTRCGYFSDSSDVALLVHGNLYCVNRIPKGAGGDSGICVVYGDRTSSTTTIKGDTCDYRSDIP
jgi:hypothetical protein